MKNNHTAFKLFAFLTITILLFGCTDAYKVPNQSVFEPLNAKQMKRALKAPGFAECYSEYSRKISMCDDVESRIYLDITWRGLYKYYDIDEELGCLRDCKKYLRHLNMCEEHWENTCGYYRQKADSIIAHSGDTLRNYFKQFLNVEFVKTENAEYYKEPVIKRLNHNEEIIDLKLNLEETTIEFKLIPVSNSNQICECKFTLWNDDYAIGRFAFHYKGSPFNSPINASWTIDNQDKLWFCLLASDASRKNAQVFVTEVCMSNGEKYSISDLKFLKPIEDYYLSYNPLLTYEKVWNRVYSELSNSSYIDYDKYMADVRDNWKSREYPREKEFVEMLGEHN